jgi:hypothetical protein
VHADDPSATLLALLLPFASCARTPSDATRTCQLTSGTSALFVLVEQRDDGCVTLRCERAATLAVAYVDACLCMQQQRHDGHVAVGAGVVQRRTTAHVPLIDCGPGIKEQVHDGHVAVGAGVVQRRTAAHVPLVDCSDAGVQECVQRRAVVVPGGHLEQVRHPWEQSAAQTIWRQRQPFCRRPPHLVRRSRV